MYEIRVYDRNRDIPWVKDEQQTHIHLIAGMPIQTENEQMVEHLRKFNNPAEHRGISIKEISKSRSVRSMTLDELRSLADSMDVEYADSDSRMVIMKKIRGEKNG